MSIRLRLTVLFGTILAATLAVFSVILYLTVAQSTRSFIEDTLALEMNHLLATRSKPLDYVWLPPESFSAGNTYWQACDAEGGVLGRSDNLLDHTLPLSPGGLHQLQHGESIYEVTRINDIPLVVYSHPIAVSGSTTGILQVARSIAEQEQALSTLQTALLTGSLLTLVLAISGGWLMAGVSLRPIDGLIRTAQMIGAERNFKRRVDYRGPQDEVGRLAATFNSMLFALDTAYQQVAQALEAQRSFIADASHELRTPLTTLRGNLALLQREPPIEPDDRRAVLADVVEENERMIRLVNDLMTLARAEYSPEIALENVPLAPLFAEIERQCRSIEPACNFRLDDASGISVRAERDMLKQVLLILLDNAFKFTPAGGSVDLTARQRGEFVIMDVRDTGTGIEKDGLPHIFQRFYRADPSRNGTGYGLGLAIARALTEKQSGGINVTSQPGKGSTFTVTLYADLSKNSHE